MVIGKRKYNILILFIVSFVVMFITAMVLAPKAITSIENVLWVFGGTIMTGLGALGVENIAKYGFGKKNKKDVE